MASTKLSSRTIARFKTAVLGRDFDVSVAYTTRARMHALNRTHRGVDSATDILSFPLSKTSGEIILCMPEVRTHARAWGVTKDAYLPYLVIHGLLHLRGLDHGAIMDKEEKKYCHVLGVSIPSLAQHGKQDRSRHRRRNLPSTGGRIAIRR